MRHLWVVEWNPDRDGRWVSTVGCGCTREDGRHALSKWRERMPDELFRLAKYIREAKK